MTTVKVNSKNSRLDLLSKEDQKAYDTYKRKTIANIDKKKLPKSEKAESKIIGAFLKINKGLSYPEDVTEEMLKEKKDDESPHVSDSDESDGDETDKDADEEDKSDDEADPKLKDSSAVLTEKELKAQQDALDKKEAEKEERRKKRELEKKLASDKNNLPQGIDSNSMAGVNMKDVPEYKGKTDKGFEFASTKFAMVVKTKYKHISKVLMPKKVDQINCDDIHWDSPEGEKILAIALYCCLNGPVGVNKRASFGCLPGEYAISDLFSTAGHKGHVSNSMWKNFCLKLAPLIDITEEDVKEAKMIRVYGKAWPFCDSELVTTQEMKAKKKDESMKAHGSQLEAEMK